MKSTALASSVIGRIQSHLMTLTRLLGLLVANMEAVQWGHLHLRCLQWFLRPYQMLIVARSDALLWVPFKIRNSLRWWTVSLNLIKRKQPPGMGSHVKRHPSPRHMIQPEVPYTNQSLGTEGNLTGAPLLLNRTTRLACTSEDIVAAKAQDPVITLCYESFPSERVQSP